MRDMSEMSNIKTGVDPDPNAPIYRVPSQSYWAELAQKELEEASNNPVKDIHTVLCVDISDSVSQGSAWEQTQQFFNDFITGLEEARRESEVNVEYVALSVFGGEVKVVQRLTTDYTLLKQAFCALRLGGPSPLVGGLLMALAGLSNTSRPSCNGIRIRPRIILITDGHPTNSHIVSGPDVCHSEPMEQVAVLLAVSNISSKIIRLHCVPVGDANLPFLEKISAQSLGKLYSYKNGRMLARRTLCTFRAGHVINSWKKLKDVSNSFGIELSLEDAMKSNLQIASSSAEEQEEILNIAREALETNLEDDDDDAEIDTDHYERDDSDVSLPPLGTRVRRGPDWDKGFQDNGGPGTIVGHHKDQKQVKVEWDETRHSGFYRYGDMGQYDVLIDTDLRVLKSELIATGCRVRRGEHWKYDNQDGTPGAIGVVLKVQEDGIVVVRWPNKSKNYYRYGAEGCFDLEICHPEENPAEGMQSIVTHPEYPLGPDPFFRQETQAQEDSIQKYHNECLRLPPLGTRVRRGVGWNKGQQDHNGPGTIIGHNEDKSQVYVEWDSDRQRDFYYFKDMERSEVVVVDEPRVLAPCELIVTGCHVKLGKTWMYGNANGTAETIGVVLDVREDGMVLVRWPNRSKHYYRFGADGSFDLEICNPVESQTGRVTTQPGDPFTPQLEPATADDVSLSWQSTSWQSHRMLGAKAEVDLDLNAPVSRVPCKSYWSDLAHEELIEGLKSHVTGIHTVLCVDISASTRQGSAWGQTQQFFNEFISGLEEVRKEPDAGTDNVALSVFGGKVKIVQPLTNNYTLLKKAFSALQPGGPSPLYGGLLMAAAALQDTPTANSSGTRIRPQIILITDGHPTDCLISAGPDVCWSDAKDQDDVLLAVKAIASVNVDVHCVPVGNANLRFLETISATGNGKLFSYKDGGALARKTICTDAIVQISQATLEINIGKDEETEFELDHYEIDDPDVKLPSLGTRVRRGPDWNKSFQDNDGPGTIVGHHKNQKQVKVEWDKSGHTDFYRYGDLGKYDVLTISEPRVLQSELIATGCLVRRGKNWKYDDQDGTPGAIGVVLKVQDDGMVVVRWPNKFKGHYRYSTEGFYDLEICNQHDVQVESQKPELHGYNPTLDLSSSKLVIAEKNQDKDNVLERFETSSTSIAEQNEPKIIQKMPGAEGAPVFHSIKNICYNEKDILGHGCNGTIVYRGKFDERDVAVKRLLKEYYSLAEQEVKLLRESDQHPNVVRYFLKEEDMYFLFIALELCEGNLQDYIDGKFQNMKNIEPIELLHQALSGLAHLHSLGIVHRDIKPENVLISKPSAQGEVRAMISDFGFSKKLPLDKMAFSSRSNILGTQGWISPEMLKRGQKRTNAVDIFSAGCMMCYVLTKGIHPFGNDGLEIQYNIKHGKFNLDSLPKTSDGFIAKDIIEKMLSNEPRMRPTAKAVLKHLLFWKKTEKLQFIEAASDYIVVKMVPKMEQDEARIVNGDWTKHLSQELQDDIRKDFREKGIRYSGSSIKDLLRVIRNKKHHYNKMAQDVRKSVGSIPDEYLDYFTCRFPLLLLHIYRAMECCAKEDTFIEFYKTD